MIKTDYHIHTNYSFDSMETMEDVVKTGISKGLKEVIFTDHLETLDSNQKISEVIDYKKYYNEILELREKYPQINIGLGAEINLEPKIEKETNDYLSKYPFDFIIGSTHAANFVDIAMSNFSQGKTRDEYYDMYFQWALKCVGGNFDYDVLGHLDYIVRYGGYSEKILDVELHQEVISEILKTLILKGKGIEINTSGLRYGLGHTHPRIEILRLFKALGGEIITVGSDSHQKETLGNNFDIAEKILKECGFKYYTRFEKRIPKFEKI